MLTCYNLRGSWPNSEKTMDGVSGVMIRGANIPENVGNGLVKVFSDFGVRADQEITVHYSTAQQSWIEIIMDVITWKAVIGAVVVVPIAAYLKTLAVEVAKKDADVVRRLRSQFVVKARQDAPQLGRLAKEIVSAREGRKNRTY